MAVRQHNGKVSDSRMVSCQTLFKEGPEVTLKVCPSLNSIFLPEGKSHEHSCYEILLETYAATADLKNKPLKNPDLPIVY